MSILNLNPVNPTRKRKNDNLFPRSTRTPALRVYDLLESNLTGLGLDFGLSGPINLHPDRELGAGAVYTTARSIAVQVPLPVTHATANLDAAEDAHASVFVQARIGDMENNLHASLPEYVVKVDESNFFNAFDDLFRQYDTSINEMQQRQQHEIFGDETEREPASSNAAINVEDMLAQTRRNRAESLEMNPPAVPIPRRTGLMYVPPVREVWVGDVHADPARVGADGNAAPVTPTDVDIDNDVESQSDSDSEMEIDDDSSVSSDSDYRDVREESSSDWDEEFVEDPDTSLTVPEEEEEVRSWVSKRPPTPFPKVPEEDDGSQDERASESETASSNEGQCDPETIDWDAYIPQSPTLFEESEEEGYEEDDEEDAEEELHDPKRPWAAKRPPSPCLIDDSSDEEDEDDLQKPLAGKRVPGEYRDQESNVEKRGEDPRRPWGAKRVPGHYPPADADDENEMEEEEEQCTRRPRAGKRIPAQYRNEGEEKDPRRPWATKTVATLPSAIDEFGFESGYDGDEEETAQGTQATDLASGVNVELLEPLELMNAKISVLEAKVRSLEEKVRELSRE